MYVPLVLLYHQCILPFAHSANTVPVPATLFLSHRICLPYRNKRVYCLVAYCERI